MSETKSLVSEETRNARLEWAQSIRKEMVDKIKETTNFEMDNELANTVLGALRDIEKQDLYFDKKQADKEENDLNRDVVVKALALTSELRKQRRQQRAEETIEPDVTVPDIDESELKDAEPDELALSNRNYKETSWDEFQMDMIRKGLDPAFILDEEGKVVSRREYVAQKEDTA